MTITRRATVLGFMTAAALIAATSAVSAAVSASALTDKSRATLKNLLEKRPIQGLWKVEQGPF